MPAVEPFPEAVHGENVCGSMWCYTGSEADFEAFIQEARDVAEPLFEMVGSMPYPALQSMVDALYPPGYQWYWKGDSLTELTDEAIAVNRQFAEVPTPKSGVHIYPTDGAVHRVAPDETAWRHRDVTWSMVITGVSTDPDDRGLMTERTRDYRAVVHPHTAGATHVKFTMDETQGRIPAAFGVNYRRLRAVKAEYDPENASASTRTSNRRPEGPRPTETTEVEVLALLEPSSRDSSRKSR